MLGGAFHSLEPNTLPRFTLKTTNIKKQTNTPFSLSLSLSYSLYLHPYDIITLSLSLFSSCNGILHAHFLTLYFLP
ncbi:hypothetical protein Lalb_Chr07g0186141 [Lupinus albus]|uniref:Uncharacterized protein n=1 Tax=Lupinus albus TaxID=3870 RepID=A0A6A4QAN9_LUPAL|nr:hypothetical protein Lalb_Chr07g0186141 [Lupinus albus]